MGWLWILNFNLFTRSALWLIDILTVPLVEIFVQFKRLYIYIYVIIYWSEIIKLIIQSIYKSVILDNYAFPTESIWFWYKTATAADASELRNCKQYKNEMTPVTKLIFKYFKITISYNTHGIGHSMFKWMEYSLRLPFWDFTF